MLAKLATEFHGVIDEITQWDFKDCGKHFCLISRPYPVAGHQLVDPYFGKYILNKLVGTFGIEYFFFIM